jgi:hypothetical protein
LFPVSYDKVSDPKSVNIDMLNGDEINHVRNRDKSFVVLASETESDQFCFQVLRNQSRPAACRACEEKGWWRYSQIMPRDHEPVRPKIELSSVSITDICISAYIWTLVTESDFTTYLKHHFMKIYGQRRSRQCEE